MKGSRRVIVALFDLYLHLQVTVRLFKRRSRPPSTMSGKSSGALILTLFERFPFLLILGLDLSNFLGKWVIGGVDGKSNKNLNNQGTPSKV